MVGKSTEAVRPPGQDTCKENMPNILQLLFNKCSCLLASGRTANFASALNI